jgi:hypothetical protein
MIFAVEDNDILKQESDLIWKTTISEERNHICSGRQSYPKKGNIVAVKDNDILRKESDLMWKTTIS